MIYAGNFIKYFQWYFGLPCLFFLLSTLIMTLFIIIIFCMLVHQCCHHLYTCNSKPCCDNLFVIKMCIIMTFSCFLFQLLFTGLYCRRERFLWVYGWPFSRKNHCPASVTWGTDACHVFYKLQFDFCANSDWSNVCVYAPLNKIKIKTNQKTSHVKWQTEHNNYIWFHLYYIPVHQHERKLKFYG